MQSITYKELSNRFNKHSKNRLIVPKLQRNLVWKQKDKNDFIDSIKSGITIPPLLLFRKEDGTYLLIDGLQRSSTILDYYKNPWKYLTDEEFEYVFKKHQDVLLEKVKGQKKLNNMKKMILTWVKKLSGLEEKDGFSAFELSEFLKEEKAISLEDEERREFIKTLQFFTTDLKRILDISSKEVDIQYFLGDYKDIPKQYERLNKTGKKLDKYETFAASWEGSKVTFKNVEIVNHIKDKYRKLHENGFEIEGYDEISTSGYQFNAYEFLYGLNCVMINKYPQLFANPADGKTPTDVFNLLTVVFGYRINQMEVLGEELKNYELDTLVDKLFRTMDYVSQILKSYIDPSGNTMVQYHAQNQILSIIGTAFLLKYDLKNNFKKRTSWNKVKSNFEKALPQRYLYEILTKNWKGAVDTFLANNVTMENLEENSPYVREVKKPDWESVLNLWFSEQMEEERNKRFVNSTKKLFLNYIYNRVFNSYQMANETEVEHLFSVDGLKDLAKGTKGMPVNCISNLAYLNKKVNASKKTASLYDYYKNRFIVGEINQKEFDKQLEEIERVIFVKAENLSLENKKTKKEKKETYASFLEERWKELKKQFYTLNDIN